ncbi:MAG TPA: LacI family DNA-binding transcriptional regulator [Jiangellaceae bacterium]
MPTLEEVARVAGVSRATVSRAVNGGARVNPKTRAAIDKAVKELGYVPNRAARSLVTRRTDSIALAIPETGGKFVGDPFLTGALQGVSDGLSDSGMQLVLLIAQRAGDTDRLLAYLRAGHVDGAVVMSHHREDHLPGELIASGLPCVFVGRPLDPGGVTVPYVDADNTGGARAATEHLIKRGAKRIATVAGDPDMPAGVDRLAGWRAAMHDAGLPTDAVAYGDFTADGGARGMTELLSAHPDLDAVFVASDLMATGALRVLRDAGRTIPDDVAVVGFDDSMLAPATTPPLTTVRQDAVKLGQRSAEILLKRIQGAQSPSGPEILSTELIIRASA